MNTNIILNKYNYNYSFNNLDCKKIRVAAYARVSSNQEIQETSLDLQKESYNKLISNNKDWTLVNVYYDKGKTGTSTSKRTGFLSMIEDCKNGKIDLILAKSISRFARNTIDTLNYTRMLRDLGIGVIFEKENINTLNITSELLLTVYAAFAQEESISISENIKRGFIQRFKLGLPKLNNIYGYNLISHSLSKNIKESQIIKTIYKMYLDGLSIPDITKYLNNTNTPSPNNTIWYRGTVSYILKNEKYMGDALMQKTVVTNVLDHKQIRNNNKAKTYYKENNHEAIISKEDYNLVQKYLLLKNTTNGSQQYPYYDYLRCPYCNKQMVQFMTPLPSTPRAWICTCHKNCSNNFILSKYIDRAILNSINIESKNIELQTLNKYIKAINIDKDYKNITITLTNEKIINNNIIYDRPSEIPNPIIKYINNYIYINDNKYNYNQGIKIINSINNINNYINNLIIIKPNNSNEIYRTKNKIEKKIWGKIKNENNN